MTINGTLPPSSKYSANLLVTLSIILLLAAPAMLPEFWISNILGRALILGIIALSLTFLAHYGGFISLAQMVIAGVAGYAIAITAPEAIPANNVKLPYTLAVPIALSASTLAGLVVGAIAVQTREIYLLMITLAIAVIFYFFAQANLDYLNGYEGIRNIIGPTIFGTPFRNPKLFYYSTLLVSLLLYFTVVYIARTPFGLVLQGIRDNDTRISALGYNVPLHRIAAFGFAGFIAGCGGVLSTIYNIGIAPGQISVHATVNILVISIVGGLGHPVGAFIGALVFTLLDTFASSIYDRDRFNTLIGAVFLFIVLASPDGITGIMRGARKYALRYRGRVSIAPTLNDQAVLNNDAAE